MVLGEKAFSWKAYALVDHVPCARSMSRLAAARGYGDRFDIAVESRVSTQTTGKEDMAYSLLGRFDVNMPLLYGEGNRAFLMP